MDSRQPRASDLVATLRTCTNLLRRHSELGERLACQGGGRPEAQCNESGPHRKLTRAFVVSFGFSSRSQCPAPWITTTVAFVATIFTCSPSSLPSDFSPPIERTGIVSRVFDSSAKSLAVCGKEAK